MELPYRAIKSNIADSLNLLVQIERRPGRRFVSEVLEILGYNPETDRHDLAPILSVRRNRSMTPESSFYYYLEDNLRQVREHEASEAFERRYQAERDDREFVRAALQGAVPEDEIERKLLLRSEFVRLNPNAYARGLIDEEKSSFHALSGQSLLHWRMRSPNRVNSLTPHPGRVPTARAVQQLSPNAMPQTEPKRRKALHTGLPCNHRLTRIRELKPARQPSDSISMKTSSRRTGWPLSCAIERAGKRSSA
jgi:hypothetical protein